MKPTSDDFKPRKDGWFGHKGIWDEVTVGTVVANPHKRTERWEVLDTAHGAAINYGETLWFKMREQTTGAEATFPPRIKTMPVEILTQNPADTTTPVYTPPSDSDAMALLVEQLGATLIATRDEATGEVTCPGYEWGHGHQEGPGSESLRAGILYHLQVGHGLTYQPTGRVDEDTMAIARLHDQGHRQPSGVGFPHRHVPEDLSFM